MTDNTAPLGRNTDYPDQYTPELLFAIARSASREACGISEPPFRGTDIWNAWELTWLNLRGLPVVATAEIRVPASTPKLIESKSLKRYLNSFAMSRYGAPDAVAERISADLSQCAEGRVRVCIALPGDGEAAANTLSTLPGVCLDTLPVTCSSNGADATLLAADPGTRVAEDVHTHLLRSLCPVTGQPDIGSLAIRYRGARIDPSSLLQYVVSYRQHEDFHEACIERMFVDILDRCGPEELSLYARYQRRGGIDINPFRSNFEDCPENIRLWRQ